MEILIREATKADLPTLLDYEQRLIDAERPFDTTLTERGTIYYDLPYMIDSPEVCLVLAEADGRIIGSGYARIMEAMSRYKYSHYALVGFMYVDPSYRGQGVNRLVMEILKEWVIKQGITEMKLEVYTGNESAIRAYEKFGFEGQILEMRIALD